ncbi:GroES-like protein [Auriculariales sp. MPI-PUGE-AT-0066]|nr:GroES-like protein [Auriculariales sp. MPI-PUGE-AT-0066]
MSSSHNALIARQLRSWKEEQVETPAPGPGEVLVEVLYSTLIPFDIEIVEQGQFDPEKWLPHIPGINLAGKVAKVGEGVLPDRLKAGDEVFGMVLPTYGRSAGGMQRFALLPHEALGKIPANIHPADATTVPDNLITSWWTLTHYLGLPLEPRREKQSFADESFLVYGASSTTGQFLIQLLALAGCTRVIAVASPHHYDYLRSLGATHTLSYRDADWVDQVVAVNGGQKVKYAIDIIATDSSLRGVGKTVGTDSKVAVLLPMKFGHDKIISDGTTGQLVWSLDDDQKASLFTQGGHIDYVRTFLYNTDENLKKNLMTTIIPDLLLNGWVKPTKKELIEEPSSLWERATKALHLLRTNAVSGQKIIIKV